MDIYEPQTLRTEKNTPLLPLHRWKAISTCLGFINFQIPHPTIARPQRNNLEKPKISATNTRTNKPNKPSLQHKVTTSITQKRVFFCLRKPYNYSIYLYRNPKYSFKIISCTNYIVKTPNYLQCLNWPIQCKSPHATISSI